MSSRTKLCIKILLILIIICSSIFLYSRYIETKGINVKEYSIVSSKIPESFYGLKIVHLSDIHYKVTTDKNDLKKVVKEINLLKPDIVILSGDLFDQNIKYTQEDIEDLKDILKSIDYGISKYAIKGEEDLKFDSWKSIMNESEFTNINDTYELIYSENSESILLVGISSNYNDNHIKDEIDRIYEENKEEYNYSILVLHEPDFIDEIDYSNFNLVLAGHSHNRQISIPFINELFKEKGAEKYYENYYKLINTKLYISSGIGCNNNLKFRFLNRPSINIYRLRNS